MLPRPFMKWASVLSRDVDAAPAVERAIVALRTELEGKSPHLLVAFVSAHLCPNADRIVAELNAAYPSALVVGCSGGGVIGGGHEAEQGPALSLLGAHLPGVTLTPFEAHSGRRTAVPPDAQALLLFADPFSCDAGSLLVALDDAAPNVVKVGGLASGASAPGGHRLFLGEQVLTHGAVGVALSGAVSAQSLVSQGCRAVGAPMFATRVEGHHVLELDGRPALQVLGALHAAVSEEEQRLMRHSLFLGLEMHPDAVEHQPGELLVRNIVGIDAERRSLAVAARLAEHQVVQFVVRDAKAAEADLRQQLQRHSRAHATAPAGGLLFSCTGRGFGLFGQADHDSRLLFDECGVTPLAGFFCSGELGPVGGRTFLHGYTSAFVLFRPALH